MIATAGEQFGFSLLDDKLQGHIDGVIVGGPEGFGYPCLWENKCLGSKSWRDLEKHRLAVSKPVYAAQVAVYQAYLELHEQPALFTAVNADTMEIYAEFIPFDGALAQRLSDRAAQIIAATDAGEQLPVLQRPDALRMPHVRLARPLLEILMSSNLSDTRFKTTADGRRRWSPPATKVQIGMVSRVLSRKLVAIAPESRVGIAMITRPSPTATNGMIETAMTPVAS